ncbi:cupin domain-containing protein [Actinomycetospora termitidis]|uniref:Cupin domain-containing protein n=1 Tax=Actinomycetospora termitidis TaxID=3053470 RepID=A0ABT7MEI4_9PSEU|nr:cupin domain-containing protein [Actinomycetospora sp. Odt1-22]MDL5158594.1 cupin domain-containing protein [Actinomycetospora sp. Odt1-22]
MSRTPVVVRTEDVTPSRRMGGAIYPLLTPASAGTHAGFLAQAVLEPGEEISEHYHPWTDEHVLVVAGAVEVVVDGTKLHLAAGDATYVRRGARHVMRQTGPDTARAVLFLGPLAPDPADGHVDTVPVPHPDAAPPRVG